MTELEMESATVGAISKALAAAQKEITAPKKTASAKVQTKDGGSYGYTYATLAEVVECLREPFTKHGLSQSQALRVVEGHMELVTTFRHESGEWLRSFYPIAAYQRPQEQGSAISYGRRYSLTALAGIAAEDDDDGAAAQHGKPKHEEEDGPAALPADAQAINELAAEIQQHTGEDIPKIVARASGFDKDGKHQAFDDPVRAANRPKWLASTKGRLEKEIHGLRAKSEPGAADAAAAFADGLETAPCCGKKHPPSEPCPKAA